MYGKSELQPNEINWLKGLTYIRTSYCKNLHAKCYLNEEVCIISSLNLYEFSQVNNNEMGVLINRVDDAEVYKDSYEEAQRIIRISDEIRISLEVIDREVDGAGKTDVPINDEEKSEKISTSRLAKKLGLKTDELVAKLLDGGLLESRDGANYLSKKGASIGGEFIEKSRFGPYFQWPDDLKTSFNNAISDFQKRICAGDRQKGSRSCLLSSYRTWQLLPAIA